MVWRGDKDYWSHDKQRYVYLDDEAHIVNAWIKTHEKCMINPRCPHVESASEIADKFLVPNVIARQA